mgnify:CR=1 FL=1
MSNIDQAKCKSFDILKDKIIYNSNENIIFETDVWYYNWITKMIFSYNNDIINFQINTNGINIINNCLNNEKIIVDYINIDKNKQKFLCNISNYTSATKSFNEALLYFIYYNTTSYNFFLEYMNMHFLFKTSCDYIQKEIAKKKNYFYMSIDSMFLIWMLFLKEDKNLKFIYTLKENMYYYNFNDIKLNKLLIYD